MTLKVYSALCLFSGFIFTAACSDSGDSSGSESIVEQLQGVWESNELDNQNSDYTKVVIANYFFQYLICNAMYCETLDTSVFNILSAKTSEDGLTVYEIDYSTLSGDPYLYNIIRVDDGKFWLGDLDSSPNYNGKSQQTRPRTLNFNITFHKTADEPDTNTGATSVIPQQR